MNNRLKNGIPKTSKFWQNWKKSQVNLSDNLNQIALGMILGDAGLHKVGKEAYIKFEQSKNQKEFIDHLFKEFKNYTFMENIGVRYNKEEIKSYWFKTYSHKTFTVLYNKFYIKLGNKNMKIIQPNLIKSELEAKGLAYWIMCDGSLQKDKKSMIIHTQSFSKEINNKLSKELNDKFNLHTKVIKHKNIYYVLFIPNKDNIKLKGLISEYIINIFKYKIPKL